MESFNTKIKLNKRIGFRAFLVFQRLLRFYPILNVVSALMAGLSLAVLTFDEYHTSKPSTLVSASEGLLVSAAMSSVTSVVLATMLLFKFEGQERATRLDLTIAWTPLAVMDVGIAEFLLGLLLWYSGTNNGWRTVVMSSQLGFMLLYSFAIAGWMWKCILGKGGLGIEETRQQSIEISGKD